MKSSFRYRFSIVIATILVVTFVSMICQLMQKPAIIHGATITRDMTISGHIQWVENQPKSMNSFAYAIMNIDGAPRSVTNILPARFNIDTTSLSNGKHKIQVLFYNTSGVPTEVATTVIVKNQTTKPTAIKGSEADTASRATDTEAAPVKSKITIPKVNSASSFREGQDVERVSKKTNCKKNRYNVILKDSNLCLADSAYNRKNRVMVLLRLLTKAADAELDWSRKSGSTVINKKKVTFYLNSSYVDVNGKRVKVLMPVTMRNGRVFAPVRLWQDLSNGDLSYDSNTRSVYLYR